MGKTLKISQEVLDRYLSGEASLNEIASVAKAIRTDDHFRELVDIMESLHQSGSLSEKDSSIPMASMAAMSEGNLCDVLCEQYILKDYFKEIEKEEIPELDNRWLKESGTPLHAIGRILESHGMSVIRKYDCTSDEMEEALSQHCRVIAVVDYGQLWNHLADGIFHAVVCLSIKDDMIRIYDPAIDGHSNYSLEEFCKAWLYSNHYMVSASVGTLRYIPHPIDVTDVELGEDLIELTEAIAENAHEVWALKRYNEGWKFGPQRDDAKLEHPDMVPYCELTEGEKYYDRDVAMNTIRLVKKLGFVISRRYTEYCRHCGEFVSEEMKYCPHCGNLLK